MMKITGMILIVLTTSAVGMYMSTGLTNRVRELQLILTLLEKIQTHIRFQKTPTKRMIQELAHMEQFQELPFLRYCVDAFSHTKHFPVAWENGLYKSEQDMHLHPDDIKIVHSIANILGSSDVEGQISALTLCTQMLQQNLQQALDKKKTYGKMYRSLGVLAGVGVVVLIA